MIKVHDLIAANQLLMSAGGEDQLPKIAAKSIEQAIELRHRIERALDYAESAPNASVHARQMARILDGTITVEDEQAEVKVHEPRPEPPALTSHRPKGKLKPGNGLGGRSTKERLAIREWIAEQGWEVNPTGRIPQKYLDLYDEAQRLVRKQVAEERKNRGRGKSRAEQLGTMALSQDEPVTGTLL